MDGRVPWFFGFARNAGGYSFPMIGTPCEVPEPRQMNAKDMAAPGRSSAAKPPSTPMPRSWAKPQSKRALGDGPGSKPRRADLFGRSGIPSWRSWQQSSAKFLLPNLTTNAKFDANNFCHADHAPRQEPGLGGRSHPGTSARGQ